MKANLYKRSIKLFKTEGVSNLLFTEAMVIYQIKYFPTLAQPINYILEGNLESSKYGMNESLIGAIRSAFFDTPDKIR